MGVSGHLIDLQMQKTCRKNFYGVLHKSDSILITLLLNTFLDILSLSNILTFLPHECTLPTSTCLEVMF